MKVLVVDLGAVRFRESTTEYFERLVGREPPRHEKSARQKHEGRPMGSRIARGSERGTLVGGKAAVYQTTMGENRRMGRLLVSQGISGLLPFALFAHWKGQNGDQLQAGITLLVGLVLRRDLAHRPGPLYLEPVETPCMVGACVRVRGFADGFLVLWIARCRIDARIG